MKSRKTPDSQQSLTRIRKEAVAVLYARKFLGYDDTLAALKNAKAKRVLNEWEYDTLLKELIRNPNNIQDQSSLQDQLNKLEVLAVDAGLYDAHDWLRQKRSESKAKPT